jgi:hypothetical protein
VRSRREQRESRERVDIGRAASVWSKQQADGSADTRRGGRGGGKGDGAEKWAA